MKIIYLIKVFVNILLNKFIYVYEKHIYFLQNVMAAEEMALQKEARKGMTNEEAEFSVESELDHQVYLWSDKYRPRKPRYFNR